MADITITNSVDLSAVIKLQDDSLLAKAKLTQLLTTARELFEDFGKPVDQADVQSFAFGGNFTSPNLLSGDLTLTATVGTNCDVTIVETKNKLLFPDDNFSPTIPIALNQAWVGVEVDLTASVSAGAEADGVGVSLAATGTMACSTFSLFTTPFPLLKDACGTAFSNFSINTNAAAIRNQLPNTVNVTDVSGSIVASVSLQQPFALNPLASADLPFNKTASIQPNVTLELAGAIEIDGDFLVRCYKKSEDVLRIGVYKKHGTTLSVSFTAGAGIEGDIGSKDILGALLSAALPKVDVAAAGITGNNAKTLNDVIRGGLTRNLSAQLNATCSAAFTHEAALLYEVRLNAGDSTATDKALGLALHGDWTSLHTLPNATCLRNIAVETVEKSRSVSVNLFGFYSATSTVDYLKSCTVLTDESGQITITDALDASRIRASSAPNAADTDKLRQALMEDFLCTATYAAVGSRMNLQLTALQSYLDYKQTMSPNEMHDNVLLGYALNLIPEGSIDALVNATPAFHHALVTATVRYDSPSLMSIFYKDPASQTQRSRDELEQTGRQVMCVLLDPSDSTDAIRLSVLKNDDAWKQMDAIGNTAVFNTIPYLSHLSTTQLAAVSSDWVSIVWWVESVTKVAPAITDALTALTSAPQANPTQDPGFMKARARLANVLGAVTRKTDAAFVHGWGAAVLFALSGRHGSAQIDLTWDSKSLHFGR
jgi:hypothetical protein